MKKIMFLFLAVVITLAAKAQDIITLTNGSQIQAKVLEVNPGNIRYKDYNNQDGPIITVNKEGVSMIQYANGSKTLFNDPYNRNNAPTVSSSSGAFRRDDNGHRGEGSAFKKKSHSDKLAGWYFGADLSLGGSNASSNDANYSTASGGFDGLTIMATKMFTQHLGLQFGLGYEEYSYAINYDNPNSPFYGDGLSPALGGVIVPVRAVYFSNSKHRAGFYATAGLDFSILGGAVDQNYGDDLSSYYNPFLVSPYVSAGVEFRNKYANTFWMFGLYYKTSVTNIYSGNGLVTYTTGDQLNSGNTGTLSTFGLSITMMHKYFRGI